VRNVSTNSNTQDSSHCDCIAVKSLQVTEQCEDRLVFILWRLSVSGSSEDGVIVMEPHVAFIAKSMLYAAHWI